MRQRRRSCALAHAVHRGAEIRPRSWRASARRRTSRACAHLIYVHHDFFATAMVKVVGLQLDQELRVGSERRRLSNQRGHGAAFGWQEQRHGRVRSLAARRHARASGFCYLRAEWMEKADGDVWLFNILKSRHPGFIKRTLINGCDRRGASRRIWAKLVRNLGNLTSVLSPPFACLLPVVMNARHPGNALACM